MTSRVQFYAFTPPTFPAPDMTPYLQAFKETDGDVTITVRDKSGAVSSITMDVREALRLSIALGAAKFAHDVVARRALADAEKEARDE